MSGPKVVRVVTREEIEAICRGHFRDVETAIAAVLQVAERLDRLSEGVQEELARQKEVVVSLLKAENWMEIQKRGPAIVARLQAYTDQIRADAVAAAAADRAKGRRLAEGARTLVAALEKAGQAVAPQLRAAVQIATTADPDELVTIEAQLSEGMRQLATASASTSGEGSAALGMADRLGAGLVSQSLGSWLASVVPPNSRETRLDAVIAELRVRADPDTVHAFERRAFEIARREDDQRDLLMDSLILEASRLAAQRRASEQAAFRLQLALASLSPLTTEETKTLAARINVAIASVDGDEGAALCDEAAALVDREAKSFAARARREAVLKGLSALGYEIREGMETAWAKDGRVVVRKPGTKDYGVELGAPADASRLQVRLVGSDKPVSARSVERDRDHEVSWCGEFEALQARVASAGGYLVIDRAIGVGVQPVKTVIFTDAVDKPEVAEIRPAARTLR